MKPLSLYQPVFGISGLKKIVPAIVLLFAATLSARDDTPTVIYTPSLKYIEGDQPVITSYLLTITSPANVAAGSNLTITPVVSVVSAPADVSTAMALSFISLSPSTLVFTGPNQTQITTVSAHVPEGTIAGEYVWAISTPGWPAGTKDESAFINADITIPEVPVAPTVTINLPIDTFVYTYVIGGPPVSIPLAFGAMAPSISPITSIDADVNGDAVILTQSGLGTGVVTANGTILLNQEGVYTVQARATNNVETSTDTVEISVIVDAPPPAVEIVAPALTSYVLVPGSPLSIPVAFIATSLHGGISSLTASVGGSAILSFTSSGLDTLSATGSGSLTINTAGTYVLEVIGSSPHGTTSVSRTITVTDQALQPPTVNIAQPLNGALFTHTAGTPALSIPFSFTALSALGANISAVSGSLNGNAVSVSASGLGSAVVGGTGNLTVNTPGTYTFVASAVGGGLDGSASVTFTVEEFVPPLADCSVEWLPPISLGKVQKGGSVLPIKFVLNCPCCGGSTNDDHNRKPVCEKATDSSVVIALYEVFADGSISSPRLFPYSPRGKNSDKDGTYAITGGQYHLNYILAKGTHLYHIDVYRQPDGSTIPQLLGTKEFLAR